jgi:hypothetical protein
MPINTTELGPGTLILGAGALAVEAQLLGCKVVPSENVTTKAARKVLSGETLAESSSATYSATLQGKFLQDLDAAEAASVVAWSWANRGTEQPVTFVPNTAADSQVSGLIIPVPLQVGADEVETDMESDFTWRFAEFPDYDHTPVP